MESTWAGDRVTIVMAFHRWQEGCACMLALGLYLSSDNSSHT